VIRPKAKDELAEILVQGNEHRSAFVRLSEHGVVRHAGRRLGDVNHLVPVRPKLLYDRAIYALVADEVHAATGAG
jgi:hypothetical protein